MNLKAYDRAAREAIIAAGQDRELFTLCGNGASADYLIKSAIVQCGHQGEYVYAELTQVSNALLTPPEETPTPWRGPKDGLPPVGTVCEYNDNCGGRWVRVEVCYTSQYTVLLKFFGEDGDCEGAFSPEEVRLRPIRTPEQIAAEERERKIKDAMHTVNTSKRMPRDVVRQNVLRASVEALIDAGYRKFEIVEDEQS